MKLNNKHQKNPYRITASKYSTHGILLNLIEELPKGAIVLDVGCNDGYLGKDYIGKYKFYGLDYMEDSVKKASKYYEDCVVYDINNLDQLKWKVKFDAIIFGDVLEHLVDGSTVLGFFTKNYLKRGGKVIISLPNVANWEVRLRLLFGKFDYTETGVLDRTHLHLYTYSSTRKMLAENGLEIIKEYGGTKTFGLLLAVFPFLKPLLAHNIIILAKKA